MKTTILIALLSLAPFEAAAQDLSFTRLVASQAKKKKPKKKKAPVRKEPTKAEDPKKQEPKKEEPAKSRVVKPVEPPKSETPPPKEEETEDKIVPEEPPQLTPEQLEEQRVEAAKKKLEAERRSQSKITPGAASRWSNKGAMTPVASPVPITAPIPERAVPITQTVATPGQDLLGGGKEEVLSARLSFSGYHLETKGQDKVFIPENSDYPYAQIVPGADRDISFLRARATMGYDHIAGSDFALHLDVEYRPGLSGSRFTDYRLNEAYVSYGLTEFRGQDAPWWGVALGRLAIREAGYAQADGLAARFRIVDWLRLGVFGGVTGNPYGYDWKDRDTKIFSIDWYTGGAFVSLQLPELIVNVAGVVTYANIAANAADFDRAYVYFDGAWLIIPELNLSANGWFDVLPNGQPVQNLNGSLSWTPFDDLSLAIGGGRFATVFYQISDGQTFVANGVNQVGIGRVIGTDGNPVPVFDAVLMTAVYNNAWIRGAYRILRDLEVNARFTALIRDQGVNDPELQAKLGTTFNVSSLRLLPALGVRYRNPEIVDAYADFTYIIDDESQASALISGGVGRGIFGFYLGADARYYVGTIGAFDAGGSLSYTFPRDWFPGALSLRFMGRFFRENVDVFVPTEQVLISRDAATNTIDNWTLLQNQDSFLLFGGIEWRL